MSLGGWGWVFRVYSLNSREAALRPLPFDILKRATRRRPPKKNPEQSPKDSILTFLFRWSMTKTHPRAYVGYEILPTSIDEMEIVVKFYHHFIRVPNFMSDTFSNKYFHVLIIIIRRYQVSVIFESLQAT